MMRAGLICLSLIISLTGCVAQQRTTTGAAAAKPSADGNVVTARSTDEKSQKLYLDLIAQLIAEGKLHAALAHLDEYRLRVVGDPAADLMRADVLARLGRFDEAAVAVRPFLNGAQGAGNQAIQAKANKIAGRIYAGRGRWGDAAAFFEKARSLTPPAPAALSNLGYPHDQYRD